MVKGDFGERFSHLSKICVEKVKGCLKTHSEMRLAVIGDGDRETLDNINCV